MKPLFLHPVTFGFPVHVAIVYFLIHLSSSVTGRMHFIPKFPTSVQPWTLVRALSDVIAYYRVHVNETDLNILLGAGIAAGQFNFIADRLNEDNVEFSLLQWEVEELRMELLCRDCRLYEEKFEGLLSEKSWLINEEPSWLSHRDFPARILPTRREEWHGNFSDFCLGRVSNGCTQTDECIEMELNPLASQYNLTHQIIFMMLAKTNKCNLSYKGRDLDLDDIIRSKCAKVYIEARQLWKKQVFVETRMCDLFIEQIALCGIMGFQDFYADPRWLHFILQRQTESGQFACPMTNPSSKQYVLSSKNHVSAVAMAALAGHLKNMILYPFEDKLRMSDLDHWNGLDSKGDNIDYDMDRANDYEFA